jgi:hypothetical protein
LVQLLRRSQEISVQVRAYGGERVMSVANQAVLTFTIFCLMCATAFIGWLIWNLIWGAYDRFIAHLGKRSMRVTNHQINEHKITPRFNVGSDVK